MSNSGLTPAPGANTVPATNALELVVQEMAQEMTEFDLDEDSARPVKHTDKEVPNNLKLSEVGYAPRYDNVSTDYRQCDQIKHDGIDYTAITKKSPVAVSFAPVEDDKAYHTYGCFVGTSEEKFVQMKIHPDTQYPSVELFIKRADGNEVSWRVFGNSLMAGPNTQDNGFENFFDYSCPVQESITDEGVSNLDMGNIAIKNAVNGGNLAQLAIWLWQPEAAITDDKRYQLVPRRPIWGVINEADAAAIARKYASACKKGEGHLFDQRDALIARLHNADELSIYRQLAKNSHDDFARLGAFMKTCFDMTTTHGNCWFVRSRSEGRILDRPQLWTEAPVPRWLGEEYVVKRSAKGEAISYDMKKWGNFRHPGVFPDLETTALFGAMGLARSVDTLVATIQALLDSPNTSNAARFTPWDTDLDTKFAVQLMCDLPDEQLGGISLVPEAGTQIKLNFREGGKEFKFSGTVVPSFQQIPGVTFCAVVETQDLNPYPFKNVDSAFREKNVTIRLEQDNLAIGREYNAFQELARGPRRKEGQDGPDFPRIMANAPPQDSKITSNPWVEDMSDEHRAEFLRILRDDHNVNEGQHDFADLFTRDENGACVLIAPPGTGKTTLTAALIRALYLTNKMFLPGVRHPILVCAPANLAVDEILHKMLAYDDQLSGMKAIRFRGGRQRVSTKHANAITTDQHDEASEARLLANEWWHGMEHMTRTGSQLNETDFGDREFHVDFSNFVTKAHGQNSTHKLRDIAREFIGKQEEVANGSLTKEKRKVLLEQLDDLEAILHREYFQDVVAAFVTLNTSMAEILVENFEPRALFADEAAMAKNGELLCPITAFWHTLAHSVFIGDPNQQRGRALAPGRNEYSASQTESFMARVQSEDGKYIQFRQLQQQHRMHPTISGPVSDTFYDGTMTNHPSTMDDQPVRNTAVQYFSRTLGDAYKGWFRFGIASDHNNVNESKKFMQTHSQTNDGECNTVIAIVEGLLDEVPPPNGRKILLSDILLTTPYKGLATDLWMRCKRKGWLAGGLQVVVRSAPQLGNIRVRTASSCQGQEGNIQIIAFTVNHKDNGTKGLRFMAERHNLNVLMSRAKYMQIAVGNFGPWMYAIKKGENRQIEGKRQPLYHFGKIIGSFYKDMQDPTSCTILGSNQAHDALFKGKPAPDKQAFALSLKVAPKRTADDDGTDTRTTFQKGKYGKAAGQAAGKPAAKKQRRGKNPKAPDNRPVEKLMAEMTLEPEAQKLLDDMMFDWKSKLELAPGYMKDQREAIKSSEVIKKPAERTFFYDKLNKVFLEQRAKKFEDANKDTNDEMDVDDPEPASTPAPAPAPAPTPTPTPTPAPPAPTEDFPTLPDSAAKKVADAQKIEEQKAAQAALGAEQAEKAAKVKADKAVKAAKAKQEKAVKAAIAKEKKEKKEKKG